MIRANSSILPITPRGSSSGSPPARSLLFFWERSKRSKSAIRLTVTWSRSRSPRVKRVPGASCQCLGRTDRRKGPVQTTDHRPQTSDQKHSLKSEVCGLKSDRYPVFRKAPGVLQRIPVSRTFETGVLTIDATIPIGKGQRELIIGDRMTGKTSICTDAILNPKDKDVICVYCCIGRTYSSLLKIVELLKGKGALDYTIVVAAHAASPGGEQYLAPYTACALGEYFMDNGKDVFIVFDDLTKHAWAYRQLSLLLERPPGRDAYPGDIFYLHSQLMERAGQYSPEFGGGSMTFFLLLTLCKVM